MNTDSSTSASSSDRTSTNGHGKPNEKPKGPASEAEFCGGTETLNALPAGVQIVSCSFDGTVGTIAARITTPITLDYSVTYTYVRR